MLATSRGRLDLSTRKLSCMHGSSEALLVRDITAIKAGTKHHHHSLLKLSSEAYAGLGVHHLLPWPHCGRAVAEVHDPLIWWMLHPQRELEERQSKS